MSKVLVVSPSEDHHFRRVSELITDLGGEIVRLDFEHLCGLDAPRYTTSFENTDPLSICCPGEPLGSLSGVWLRRLNSHYQARSDCEQDERYYREAFSIYISWLCGLLDEAARGPLRSRFINTPDGVARGENKALQTLWARKLGFRVPETVITRDVAAVRKLLDAHGTIVCKSLNQFRWTAPSSAHTAGHTFTALIDRSRGDIWDCVPNQFCIYQPYVEKAYELRVFFLDQSAFALRIETERGSPAEIDWRRRGAMFAPHSLDERVSAACRRLMDALGLRSASFDLIVDVQGDVHFVELNQAGNFLWMDEIEPELGIGAAFARALLYPASDRARPKPELVG